MKNSSFTFIYLLAIISSSCSTETTYTVEMVDGVRTVHNLKPVYEGDSKISLEFVRQIGEIDGDDENLQFFSPGGIDFDNEGNMYILDRGNYRIQKLDKDGNFLLSFGKEGQGPGEFTFISRIEVLNNTVSIYNSRPRKIEIYSQQGEYLRMLSVDNLQNFAMLLNDGNFLIQKSLSDYIDDNEKRPAFYKTNENGSILQSFGSARFYAQQDMRNRGNSSIFAIDNDNNIYQVYKSQNKIIKYSSNGKTLVYITRNRPFEESIIAETKSAEFRGSTVILYIWNQFHEFDAVVDSQYRLWVLSVNAENDGSTDFNVRPDLYNLDVYSQDGILLESFPWDSAAYRYLLNTFEDKIYFTNNEDMTIMEYRIVEH